MNIVLSACQSIASYISRINFISKSENFKANNFNLIRYILALLVIYSHSYGLLLINEPSIFYSSYGNFAVKCFFALSGYFIALSCLRTNHIGHYFWNRALRIMPALIIALILSHYIGKYFNNFIQNPVPYILNGPVWTLSWEIFCYVLLGFFMWYHILNDKALGAILASSWMLLIVFPLSNDFIIVVAPLILLFFSGAYIALNREKFNLRIIGIISLIILIAIKFDPSAQLVKWFFNHVVFLYGPNLDIEKYRQLVYFFSLPFALLWLGNNIKIKLFHLKNDYSYGMYIYAWPIQQVIINISIIKTYKLSPLVLFFISWALTHVIAMISWHVVEKNVLRLKY